MKDLRLLTVIRGTLEQLDDHHPRTVQQTYRGIVAYQGCELFRMNVLAGAGGHSPGCAAANAAQSAASCARQVCRSPPLSIGSPARPKELF